MRTPPASAVSYHGVQACQRAFSCTPPEPHLLGLAGCEQPLVEVLDALVVTRGDQRCGGGTLETTGGFENYQVTEQIFEASRGAARRTHSCLLQERPRNLSPGGRPLPDCRRGFSNSGPCNCSGSAASVDVSRGYGGDYCARVRRPRRASRSGGGRTRVMSFDPYHSTGRHSARRRSPRTSRSPCGTWKPSRAPGRTGILLCSGTV